MVWVLSLSDMKLLCCVTDLQHYTDRLSATLAHQDGQDSALSSIYKDNWVIISSMTSFSTTQETLIISPNINQSPDEQQLY